MSLEWMLYFIDVLCQLSNVAAGTSLCLSVVAVVMVLMKIFEDYKGPWWHIGTVIILSLSFMFVSALVPQKETMRQIAAIRILKSDPMMKVGERLLKKLEDVINLPAEEVITK